MNVYTRCHLVTFVLEINKRVSVRSFPVEHRSSPRRVRLRNVFACFLGVFSTSASGITHSIGCKTTLEVSQRRRGVGYAGYRSSE